MRDLAPTDVARAVVLIESGRTYRAVACHLEHKALVFDRDVTVKASSKTALNLQNLIKTVKFLVSTFFLVERCV
jgi:hypothetical protein